MAVRGFRAKCWTGVEWSGVDTPQTVTTTRAPAVLKSYFGKEQLNLWVRCAFDGVDKKPFAHEVQTTLCLWQFF